MKLEDTDMKFEVEETAKLISEELWRIEKYFDDRKGADMRLEGAALKFVVEETLGQIEAG